MPPALVSGGPDRNAAVAQTPAHFVELISDMAESRADHPAFRFVSATQDGELHDQLLTYRQLDQEARRIGGWLQQRTTAGDRVLLPHHDGPPQVTSLLGCLYAGVVPVLAPPLTPTRHSARQITSMVRDAAVTLVLGHSRTAGELSQLLAAEGRPEVVCAAADLVRPTDPDAWRPPSPAAGDTALLQYTSGSVSDPKGVVISHGNLLANQRAIREALGTSPESIIGSWLPSHHDMGLIGGILHPLSLGATGVMMPAISFVKRPVRWLQMISQYNVDVSGAPDFAYQLCLRRISDDQLPTLDLSSWRIAVTGAEPVRPRTIRDFAKRFAPAGLRPEALFPAYGLAEGTLMVAGGPVGRRPSYLGLQPAAPGSGGHGELGTPGGADDSPGHGTLLVSSGRPQGCELRIVDPESRQTLPPRHIGEVWLRGPSVSAGYWSRPSDSAEIFRARTAEGETGFFRTGDLGGLDDAGELYVTGRLRDMVISNGRNIHPQDIEHSVQRVHELFAANAAFGVSVEQDRVVVVQELRNDQLLGPELAKLATTIQAHVAREFEVSADAVILVRPGTIRRAHRTKMSRSVIRELFLTGRLSPLHQTIAPSLLPLVGSRRAGSGR